MEKHESATTDTDRSEVPAFRKRTARRSRSESRRSKTAGGSRFPYASSAVSMLRMKTPKAIVGAVLCVLAGCGSKGAEPAGPAYAPEPATHADPSHGDAHEGAEDSGHHHAVGKVNFPISCQPAAKRPFELGVAMLHHMMYEQARAHFEKAAAADGRCAMAHWGVAMTLVAPLWPGRPSAEQLKQGLEAVERARALAPPTEREKAHIEAIAAFYQEHDTASHEQRLKRWEEKARVAHENNPDDMDAMAFYSLVLVATAPKDDKTFANQLKAGAMLEKLFAQDPEHPGAIHYLIHAYDHPALAEKAVPAARVYDKIAPDVPHALHMPSHIFVRLGHWDETISWNVRSAAAALRQPVGDAVSHHYPHALDYKVYGYLQKAQDKKAMEALAAGTAHEKYQESFISAYALGAMPARIHLERRQWGDAAAMPTRTPENFNWDAFPWTESMPYFARGIGAARTGKVKEADAAVKKLDEIRKATEKAGEPYWARQVKVQRDAVAAWVALARKSRGQAVKLMRAAADSEDGVDKHPVTPGPVLPARELLGDMLMEIKRPAEALAAYEAALLVTPNRLYAYHGAARAADAAKQVDKARRYYEKVVELTREADSERPEVVEAKAFLAKQ
jgi:tetratricopeptide (TPR) repeat protein